jgi:hypothetical protein
MVLFSGKQPSEGAVVWKSWQGVCHTPSHPQMNGAPIGLLCALLWAPARFECARRCGCCRCCCCCCCGCRSAAVAWRSCTARPLRLPRLLYGELCLIGGALMGRGRALRETLPERDCCLGVPGAWPGGGRGICGGCIGGGAICGGGVCGGRICGGRCWGGCICVISGGRISGGRICGAGVCGHICGGRTCCGGKCVLCTKARCVYDGERVLAGDGESVRLRGGAERGR